MADKIKKGTVIYQIFIIVNDQILTLLKLTRIAKLQKTYTDAYMYMYVWTYICLSKHENIYFEHDDLGNYTKYNISKMQNEKVLDSVRTLIKQFHLVDNIKTMAVRLSEGPIYYFFFRAKYKTYHL